MACSWVPSVSMLLASIFFFLAYFSSFSLSACCLIKVINWDFAAWYLEWIERDSFSSSLLRSVLEMEFFEKCDSVLLLRKILGSRCSSNTRGERLVLLMIIPLKALLMFSKVRHCIKEVHICKIWAFFKVLGQKSFSLKLLICLGWATMPKL